MFPAGAVSPGGFGDFLRDAFGREAGTMAVDTAGGGSELRCSSYEEAEQEFVADISLTLGSGPYALVLPVKISAPLKATAAALRLARLASSRWRIGIASPDEILHWWPDAATADAATANATGPPVSDLARYRRANTIAHAIDLGSGPASDYLAMIERPQAEKAAQREAEAKAARLAEEQSLSEELETLERHGRVDGR
jgi:hypothetical protein